MNSLTSGFVRESTLIYIPDLQRLVHEISTVPYLNKCVEPAMLL
jgi:hypothetical protein